MTPADRVRLELLDDFRRSARERLERIGTTWVAAETDPPAAVKEGGQELLRELHTLKGEAKLMGFNEVSQVAHRAEELVLAARDLGFKVPPGIGDLVLRAVDALSALVHTNAGAESGVDLPGLGARFDAALRQLGAEGAPAAARGSAAAPAGEEPARAMPAHGPPRVRPGDRPAVREQFLRVDVEVARRFSDAASEAVIAHARYQHTLAALRTLTAGAGAAAPDPRFTSLIDHLDEQLHAGGLLARELEQGARQLRLVPLAPVFRIHTRAVRELARELGKKATLDVSDADVAIDRNVVDRVGEPLVHLLRNCVDHGLESPSGRLAAGKPEIGRIQLSAERTGGDVTIIVEDDGRGVDVNAVYERAVELGLCAAGQPLSEGEALGLLFAPGFSTRKKVTETSGRGVGLDVVQRQVESLGGAVRVSTRPGLGTRFELRVPVSVSLTRALIVEQGGALFAIPEAAVEAVLAPDPEGITLVHTRRTIGHQGHRVPVTDLSAVLDTITHVADAAMTRAVIVRHEDQRVALMVDGWRGTAEVVVKPLGAPLAGARVALGACVLDGGDLAIALAPSELVARALGELPRVRMAAARTPRAAREQRVLLAEDSAITRTMVARLLRMLGYDVREAEDGARALRLLEEGDIDLLITDIEMPNVDGIELVRRLRAEDRWRRLPVIVLSTRGSAQDKERAVSAGADAYLVKTEFSEGALRDVLARHLDRGRA